jgi:hypothetical protein
MSEINDGMTREERDIFDERLNRLTEIEIRGAEFNVAVREAYMVTPFHAVQVTEDNIPSVTRLIWEMFRYEFLDDEFAFIEVDRGNDMIRFTYRSDDPQFASPGDWLVYEDVGFKVVKEPFFSRLYKLAEHEKEPGNE